MPTSIYICDECEAPLAKRTSGKKQSADARRKHLRALIVGCTDHPGAGLRLTFTDLAPDRDPEAIRAAAALAREERQASPEREPRRRRIGRGRNRDDADRDDAPADVIDAGGDAGGDADT